MTDLPALPKLLSPCHQTTIKYSLADGVQAGFCSFTPCGDYVIRINPRTGLQEWLDGQSPWTRAELRPVEAQYQNPVVLSRLPVFNLRSPCHSLPIIFHPFMGQNLGVCPECSSVFARFNAATNRVERANSEAEALSESRLPEFGEEFQPR